MTVSTEISREEYTGNGVTTDFDYRFRVFSADELVVSVSDTTENISTLVLNTDYTVTGAGSRTGGKVKLVNPLANAWRISIERDLPVTQETDIRNQGNFFPEVHEDAFDKLTMLIQQAFGVFGLALRKPNWLAKYYDALGNRIANLGNPVNPQDATSKSYVDSTQAANFNRTLRVPESSVRIMAPKEIRKNALIGTDDNGDPVPIFSWTDTADLAIKLASSNGTHYIGLPYGGTLDAYINTLTPEMFGAVGDGVADDTSALQAAINACRTYGVFKLVGKGTYRLFNTVTVAQFNRGFTMDLYRLVADGAFPAPVTWDTATPLITVGDSAVAMVGINIRVENIDGNNRAAGIMLTARGCGTSRFHIDTAIRCQGVYKTYQTTWPCASNWVTGGFWHTNTFGVYLRRGTSDTQSIVEGHKIFVKFIADNKFFGVMGRGGSQYLQLSGDLDFNGRWLSEVEVGTLTGISNGTIVSNGTVSREVLARYNHQGRLYMLTMETASVEAGNSPFAAGQTLTTAGGYSQTILGVRTCNESSNGFYFDYIHDYRGTAFAKVEVDCGYLGGVVGELQHTSRIAYGHSKTGVTNSFNGLMVTNSGASLSFYNRFRSDISFMEELVDKVVIKKALSTQTNRTEGLITAVSIPSTTTVFTDTITLPYITSDTYIGERSLFKIYISGNLPNTGGEITAQVDPGAVTVIASNIPTGIFLFQFSGRVLQIRQGTGQTINFFVNAIRYA